MADSKNKRDATMTTQEAGHLGGEATKRTHDRSFYEEIGSKGGHVSPGNFKNDPERASEAGRKGGKATSRDDEA